jgi:hypothetical protein
VPFNFPLHITIERRLIIMIRVEVLIDTINSASGYIKFSVIKNEEIATIIIPKINCNNTVEKNI